MSVVFSFFRDVLAAVGRELAAALPGVALLGPLAGGRQELVDRFGAVAGAAVLLAQVQAGGVGLNLQAASAVVLCEPQVKPTLESQAVARVHRLGQVRRVRAHWLLTSNGRTSACW